MVYATDPSLVWQFSSHSGKTQTHGLCQEMCISDIPGFYSLSSYTVA